MLLAFNISLISTPTSSAQFHPCVRTQTARSRGWSSSQWSSQPRFRQAVAWGAGQDGWQGVLPPPSHCFIQFLRNLGLWVVRHRKELFPLEINTYNVCNSLFNVHSAKHLSPFCVNQDFQAYVFLTTPSIH